MLVQWIRCTVKRRKLDATATMYFPLVAANLRLSIIYSSLMIKVCEVFPTKSVILVNFPTKYTLVRWTTDFGPLIKSIWFEQSGPSELDRDTVLDQCCTQYCCCTVSRHHQGDGCLIPMKDLRLDCLLDSFLTVEQDDI